MHSVSNRQTSHSSPLVKSSHQKGFGGHGCGQRKFPTGLWQLNQPSSIENSAPCRLLKNWDRHNCGCQNRHNIRQATMSQYHFSTDSWRSAWRSSDAGVASPFFNRLVLNNLRRSAARQMIAAESKLWQAVLADSSENRSRTKLGFAGPFRQGGFRVGCMSQMFAVKRLTNDLKGDQIIKGMADHRDQ